MSKLERLNANVLPFAINSPEGNRYAFGTTTSSNDINVNYNENIKKGFGTGANEFPELEDFNALMYTDTYLTSYLYQAGIPEWNHRQEYYINSVVMGSNGFIYKSLVGTEEIPNVNSNPTVVGNTNWKSILNDDDYALINGDETKKFKVADAQTENEAVNKKQIDELELRLNDSIEAINDSIETISDSVGKNTTTVTTATKVVGAGYMGEFGQGLWNTFNQNGTFTIPNDVTKIRVRVVGAGGGGKGGGKGGAGGGYAHGVFDVVAGTTYTVTVGTGGTGTTSSGTPTAGGTSSFGALISATGGGANGDDGGIGIGGDFQAQGGKSINSLSGGGGAGSQLGNGGNAYAQGGAGINNGHSFGQGGGSAFASSDSGNIGAQNIAGIVIVATLTDVKLINNPIDATIRFPFDCFVGGGASSAGSAGGGGTGGGGGASSASSVTAGGTGGGGGTGAGSSSGGAGGIGGGGGASSAGSSGGAGGGGTGLVIVEW
ncbi:hypothetical protein [Aliarcobacter cryaerophilus]|uniref:hypothetical protein n=1 Tax=Aliarcobacter cryaerophilus TaxID=28198 RepID=UPI003DA52480